jgi:4-aminobutyrate aminotransferase/(S)-3-amino-2-methylpropionate transaminase
VLDEVQTGFARTGDLFAANHEGVVPDMVTTAKGIAGGLPLSAVTGRAEIMDSAHGGGLGGTYSGSPVSCAAALAAIETYEAENLIERAREIGAVMRETLIEMQQKDSRIGDVRGRGAMQAIELVEAGTKTPAVALTAAVAKFAGEHGVILLTCGTYSNVIRFLPPLSISDELLREGLGVVAEALTAL